MWDFLKTRRVKLFTTNSRKQVQFKYEVSIKMNKTKFFLMKWQHCELYMQEVISVMYASVSVCYVHTNFKFLNLTRLSTP